ncbi:RecQ family ATP-dependent DNA helicase [Corynebacterium guangdongense]|uniref:RecQ family ATP-dependent DNA helicase n=1 Tax=Corynebacterium guangdongense TaxID=1783348 RepID=UPI0025B4F675|nr:ATP-dependent DNA helicase RecQ [Corynebacterium guangdongense]
MTATRDDAQRLLEGIAGPEARLRDDQWVAIDALVNARRRMLVVQRTGWGKSAVYFIAAKLLRRAGHGPSIIISPLLALMRNQVQAASGAGIVAATLNSANMTEWAAIEQSVTGGGVDVLLISPERLNNPDFRTNILPQLAESTGMVVVDEAHCISDWGHDFRPDYRRIKDLLAGLRPGVPVLATTATANDRVVADVQAQLGPDTGVLRGGLDRESLHLNVVHLPDTTQRPAWLASNLAALPGSGIVYCLTVSAAEDLAEALTAVGWNVAAYTGRTEAGERERLEQALIANELKALIATSALGMGFDKRDLGFVVHLGAPSSPISYYQQIGRAGRGTDRAEVILLPGAEDRQIWDYFASVSFPEEETVRTLLGALEEADGAALSTIRLETAVDLSRTRIEQTLKVLDVDGAVQRVRGGWVATGRPWSYDAARYRGIDEARTREQDAMLEYQRTGQCRLVFLRSQLDDPTLDGSVCGRCDNCTGNHLDPAVDAAMADRVTAKMRAPGVLLTQRRQWPSGLSRVKGKITGVGPGRALGRLNDVARGPALRELVGERAWVPGTDWKSDPWLSRIVAVLADWDWTRRPTTVVALGASDEQTTAFLARVAQAIAAVGRMDFGGVLPVAAGAGEVTAQNSAYRVLGLLDHYDVRALAGELSGEAPILLLTDVVDTGWSVTVAGAALHTATGREVLPFALAARG